MGLVLNYIRLLSFRDSDQERSYNRSKREIEKIVSKRASETAVQTLRLRAKMAPAELCDIVKTAIALELTGLDPTLFDVPIPTLLRIERELRKHIWIRREALMNQNKCWEYEKFPSSVPAVRVEEMCARITAEVVCQRAHPVYQNVPPYHKAFYSMVIGLERMRVGLRFQERNARLTPKWERL